jgi:hypothetical protein
MLVYGIRCDSSELINMPAGLVAEYYTNYGLLVFPAYSRPTLVTNHTNPPSARFLNLAKRIIEQPYMVHEMDDEHPFVSELEGEAIDTLHPTGASPGWYHVPLLATRVQTPHLQIE